MLNKFVIFSLAALFLSACGSSSDAKKVEVSPAPVAVVEKAEIKKPEAPTETQEAKKSEPKQTEKKEVPLQVDSSKYQEGKHYVEIFPEMQTDSAPGKVEVVELMWLGCPHCYSLEPRMLKYKKNHPDFVEFKQIPAMLNPSWAADANIFYIAEILDPSGEKELVTQIFQAIHDQKRRLRNPDAAKRFFVQLGYTSEQVDKAKSSMLFQSKIKRAQEVSNSSQATSVPTVIINGKYRTSPYIAGSEDNLMEIIDMLTKREKK